MSYVFYPDVFWVTNFGMDVLVLFLVRRLKRSRSSPVRILFAAAFGATFAVVLFLKLHNFILYQLLLHGAVNPAVIFMGFPVRGAGRFFKDVGLTYLMTVFFGGILSFGMMTLGQWKYFFLWAFCAFGLVLLTLGWLEGKRSEGQCFQVLLLTGERTLTLTGFWDTGNLLEDPYVRQPVHIIEEGLLNEELAKEKLLVRYIPFHSLGQEQGLIKAVTLKAMYLSGSESEGLPAVYIEKPVFGLAGEKLFQKEKYQIILNARCISA